MDTSALQIDPEELKRNLAITLGTQAPQLNALRGPQVAGPGPIAMPQAKPPDLSVAQPKVNAPRGTVEGDQADRSRLLSSGPGVDQISGRIKDSSFGQNHPNIAGVLGPLAQGLGKVGSLAVQMATPFGPLIPGTEEHHLALLNQANHQIGDEEGERQKEAETQASQAEIPWRQAQTAHEQAETDALGQPKPKEESWKVIPEYTGPNGEPIEVEQNSGQIKIGGSDVSGIKPKPSKEVTPQRETYDSLIKQGMTPVQAYEKIREKPGGTTINEGTWSLQEDASGKPILLNSKTGEAKDAPAGIAKSGTHAKAEAAQKKEMEPIEGAVGYASDYLKNGAFTGPGDEALQEKFFELAKPSTGFRMTQQQMAMLQNSRSWMGGLEGHLRHATTGTWFSDEQRKQIVDTMNQLATEKRKAAGTSTPTSGGTQNDPLGIR